MKNFKNVLRFFVSFLLMFALIVMQICSFVNLKVLNGSFYKVTLEKSDYFTLLRQEIDYGFKNLSMITSIPEEVFTDSISSEAIKTLSYKNIDSAENYMKYKNKYIDNRIDSKLISNNLEAYAKENNISVDENLRSQIATIAEDAERIVSNHAVLFNIKVVEKYSQFERFRKVLFTVYSNQLLSVVAVLFLMGVLMLLNRKRLRRSFLWIGSSFIPAALITMVPSVLALIYKIPYQFAVDTSYLKVALRDISVGYINYFIVTSIIYLLIGISAMWFYTYLSKKYHVKRNSSIEN